MTQKASDVGVQEEPVAVAEQGDTLVGDSRSRVRAARYRAGQPGNGRDASAAERPVTAAPVAVASGYHSPGRSAMVHMRLVVAITLLATALGVGYGVMRPPVYKGEARLYVGKMLSLTNTAAIAGLANAGSQIASDYARLITTSTVKTAVEKRLHHPGSLGGRLTASPVPQSPLIRVDATAPSKGAAVALAQAGAAALVSAVDQINSLGRTQVNQLQQAYAKVENTIGQLTTSRDALQAEIGRLQALPGAVSNVGIQRQINSLQAKVNQDNTAIQVAQLKAGADSAQYQTQVSSLRSEERVISPVGSAYYVGNDRKTFFEIALIVGVIGGLIVAVSIATIIDIRHDRRSRTENYLSPARG